MAATRAASDARATVVRAFAVSITMALLMVLMALGFKSIIPHFTSGGDIGSWLIMPTGVALVVFALSFVASAVLLDRAGTGSLQSVIVGGIVALGITILILTIYAGAKYLLDGMPALGSGTLAPGNDALMAGFALALIGSAIIDRLILKF